MELPKITALTLKIIILAVFVLSFHSDLVYSYEINVVYRGNFGSSDILKIERVEGEHTLINNKDMYIKIEAIINAKEELLNYTDHFDIIFNPREWHQSPPVRNIKYNVTSLDDRKVIKSGILNKNGEIKETHFRYNITIPINESDFDFYDYKHYKLTLEYILKNHVFKQGDYYVVGLNFPNMNRNMDDSKLSNTLILPYPTSVPYRFPEGVKSYRVVSPVGNGKWGYERWAFDFIGSQYRTFWYYDVNEAKKKNLLLILLGALFGVFLSGLFDILKTNKKTLILILISSIIAIMFLLKLYF